MRFRFSLFLRLVLSLLIAALVPLIGYSAAQWQHSRRIAQEDLGHELRRSCETAALVISELLERERSSVVLLAASGGARPLAHPKAVSFERGSLLPLARYVLDRSGRVEILFERANLEEDLRTELRGIARRRDGPGSGLLTLGGRAVLLIRAQSVDRRAFSFVEIAALRPLLPDRIDDSQTAWFRSHVESWLAAPSGQPVARSGARASDPGSNLSTDESFDRARTSFAMAIPGTQLRLLASASLEARPTAYGRQLVPAVLLALALVSILSVAAFRELVQPIQLMLRRQPRSVLRSEMAERGDEISELSRSFEALAKSVEDREALARNFLGRYEVLEVVGEGATGTVFKGWDSRLERPVALKTLRLDRSLADQKGVVAQLRREAVAMASLNDAHIVAVYDVEQSEEMAFIAMELVEGLSLEQTLRLAGPLSVKETVRIGVAVARALAAGHRNGVLHRDLKSANVLLGEDRTVKVADFGVLNAVLLDGEESLLSGTPGFIAPESIEDGVYDEQSDLFGLGCVLYHCLVGEGPFAASTVAATLELTCQSVDLGTLQDLAPAPLALLIRELLSRDRAQRPSSARSVIERLEPLLAEE